MTTNAEIAMGDAASQAMVPSMSPFGEWSHLGAQPVFLRSIGSWLDSGETL
jgi:hypothetical protein